VCASKREGWYHDDLIDDEKGKQRLENELGAALISHPKCF
jgi:hypothetical protein